MAEREYWRALRSNPHYSEALKGLGEVYFRQDQIDEAIAEYREALRQDRWASPSYWNLALALEKRAIGRGSSLLATFSGA